MRHKVILLVAMSLMASCLLAGCGTGAEEKEVSTSVEESLVEEVESTPESTELPHEHVYTDAVTTEATCLADGEKTFTCECGDTYTEIITATGHIFENYVSNEDATYLADGTETATCVCGETDTRIAEGSMLTYTYTEMEATMYAQQTVNVRSLPSTDGEKLGGLSANDEVKVTGQCTETNWYRIEYAGNVAYVSNNYLGADKVVQAQTVTDEDKGPFPYETYRTYDDGGIYVYFYYPASGSDIDRCSSEVPVNNIIMKRYPQSWGACDFTHEYIGTYEGEKYYKFHYKYVTDENGNKVRW